MRRYNNGFTLIELMIVVLIVGIITAVAYPSYTRYVEKARRADATSALLDATQRLERCYTQFNAYNNAACNGIVPAGSPDGHYALTSTIGANTFTLTATAQGVQLQDSRCRVFTLDNTGARTATDAGGVDRTALCW